MNDASVGNKPIPAMAIESTSTETKVSIDLHQKTDSSMPI